MREHCSVGKKLQVHPWIGIFSHEARSRTRSRKSTTAGDDRNTALWSIVCSVSKEELVWGRTAALYNRTSFSFVASQDLVSVDTFHWHPAELEDSFWEEWVSSRREESAVASDCWFARAFCMTAFSRTCGTPCAWESVSHRYLPRIWIICIINSPPP